MSCSCAGPYEDSDDEATVWRETRVTKTRKAHRCYECGDTILAGSRCCKAEFLYDGQWGAMYRCISCSTYVEYVSMAAKLCPLWGHAREFVSDNDLHFDFPGILTLRGWRDRDFAATIDEEERRHA